jgi:hypothetical protein
LLVIAVRRRHLPLVVSRVTASSIGLIVGAAFCNPFYGPGPGQLMNDRDALRRRDGTSWRSRQAAVRFRFQTRRAALTPRAGQR